MKYIFLIVFCGLSYLSLAQVGKNKMDNVKLLAYHDSLNKTFPKNTVYLELLGNGGIYSINYDRIFYQHNKFKMSYRIGVSVTPSFSVKIGRGRLIGESTRLFLPVGINFIFGKSNKFLEFGIGYTISRIPSSIHRADSVLIGYENRIQHNATVCLSYRRQSKKGLFFKSGVQVITLLNPATSPNGAKISGFLPWVNISIGKSF